MDHALLPRAFFERDVVAVAHDLVGAHIVREHEAGRVVLRITEVQAYRGPSDSAAHSRAGNAARTAPMFADNGRS